MVINSVIIVIVNNHQYHLHHIMSIKDPHQDETTQKQWRREEDMKPYHHHAIPSFELEPHFSMWSHTELTLKFFSSSSRDTSFPLLF